MKYDSYYGRAPLVGVELEVMGFTQPHFYSDAIFSLENLGMMPPEIFRDQRHQWKCKCLHCADVHGKVFYPVQLKASYDGSLPVVKGVETGVEFISSAFPPHSIFLDSLRAAYDEILTKVWWKLGLADKSGRPSAPSFHVHCSIDENRIPPIYSNRTPPFIVNMQRVLALYYPELIALAMSCGFNRENLFFRSWKYDNPHDGSSHHIFIAPSQSHFEWRIWEAPIYDVPDQYWWYYEGAMFISSSLTQALMNGYVLRALEGIGLVNPWPPKLETARDFLESVNKKRMEALYIAATKCSTVVLNQRGLNAIGNMFSRAQETSDVR